MTDRLKSLKRIGAVQARMVRLAELRLAAAERARAESAADQARLRAYIAGDGALGMALARAALKSIQLVDRRLVQGEHDCIVQAAKRDALRRRERTVAKMAEAEAIAARRAEEDRALTATLEAWLARGSASLP